MIINRIPEAPVGICVTFDDDTEVPIEVGYQEHALTTGQHCEQDLLDGPRVHPRRHNPARRTAVVADHRLGATR